MTTIAVDGLNEETFRRVIEGRLRQGKPSEAVEKLRALLAPYARPGGILPERFLTISSEDLHISGWDALGDAIARRDQPGWPVTALSVAFGWPGEEIPQPDADGRLTPLVETGYFTDRAYPFSQSAREDLLDGYSYHGCTWADECEATDNALSIEGIDDLHGALARLEAHLLDSDEPDEEEIRAGSLGACLLSALLVQAVGLRIERDGLPRPLCVLAGSNGVYPYFDAPVAGMPADVLKAAEAEEDEIPLGQGVPGPRYSSLLVTGIPRARKRAVLVLDESAEETALRNANLRGLVHGEDHAAPALPEAPAEPLTPDLTEAGIIPIPGGPLMAKKSAKQSWDFRDMLSPREPELPASDPVQSEQGDAPVPADPAAWDDWDDWDDEPLPAESRAPEIEPEAVEPAFTDTPEPEIARMLPEPEPEPPVVEPALPEAEPLKPAKPFGERLPRETEEPEPAPRIPVLSVVPVPEPGFALLDSSLHQRLQALVALPAAPEPEPEFEPEPDEAEAPAPAIVQFGELPEGPVWPLGIGWLEEADTIVEAAAPPPPPESHGLWSRLRAWIRPRG